MTDEEKEALRNFKSEYESCDHYSSDLIIELDDAEIILNLIKKQSEEMEELKEERKKYPIAMNDKQYKKVIELAQKDIKEELDRQINARIVNEEFIENNFISKDKIKAKIEEYKELLYRYEKDLEEKLHYVDKENMNCIIAQIQVLQSLLEKE